MQSSINLFIGKEDTKNLNLGFNSLKADLFKNLCLREDYYKILGNLRDLFNGENGMRFLGKGGKNISNEKIISELEKEYGEFSELEKNELNIFLKIKDYSDKDIVSQLNEIISKKEIGEKNEIIKFQDTLIGKILDNTKGLVLHFGDILGIKENEDKMQIGEINSIDGKSLIGKISKINGEISQKVNFYSEKILEKDKKIFDQKSKIIYLEGENLSKDKKNSEIEIEKKNILSEKEILEKNKIKIQESNKKLVQEKEKLEEQLINSENKKTIFGKIISKISGKNKILIARIEELNLTISKNNDILLSFKNQIEELSKDLEKFSFYSEKNGKETLGLRVDKKELEEENLELKNELNGINETINNLVEEKKRKEEEMKKSSEELNNSVSKVQSLKQKMQEKLKK